MWVIYIIFIATFKKQKEIHEINFNNVFLFNPTDPEYDQFGISPTKKNHY